MTTTTQTAPVLPVSVELTREQIEACFVDAPTQGDYIMRLYRLLYGEALERVEKLDSSPRCSRDLWKEICAHAQKWDNALNRTRAYDKQCFPGGAWLNYGFSAPDGSQEVTGRVVYLAPVATWKGGN
jgi:hypothetical protein